MSKCWLFSMRRSDDKGASRIRSRGLSIFFPRLTFHAGPYFKALPVANRDLADIESIASDGRISARLYNDRQFQFDAKEHRHFDQNGCSLDGCQCT